MLLGFSFFFPEASYILLFPLRGVQWTAASCYSKAITLKSQLWSSKASKTRLALFFYLFFFGMSLPCCWCSPSPSSTPDPRQWEKGLGFNHPWKMAIRQPWNVEVCLPRGQTGGRKQCTQPLPQSGLRDLAKLSKVCKTLACLLTKYFHL